MLKQILVCLVASGATLAHADVYKITITNGSAMGLSPGVLYSSANAEADSHLGAVTTAPFVKLCETGATADRAAELRKKMSTVTVMETGGIAAGESKTFEVQVDGKNVNGIHFETMYGKTKDLCGVFSVNRHSLTALSSHIVSQVAGKDQVVLSGGFTEPTLTPYSEAHCESATKAVDCLRAMAAPIMGMNTVRSFNGYLPSVIQFLEDHYGSAEALTLLVPTAGAIRFKAELKH